jgi:hypothetical protein
VGSELSFWRTIGILDGPSYRTEAYAIVVLVDVFDPTSRVLEYARGFVGGNASTTGSTSCTGSSYRSNVLSIHHSN